jgi:hypothetical protein
VVYRQQQNIAEPEWSAYRRAVQDRSYCLSNAYLEQRLLKACRWHLCRRGKAAAFLDEVAALDAASGAGGDASHVPGLPTASIPTLPTARAQAHVDDDLVDSARPGGVGRRTDSPGRGGTGGTGTGTGTGGLGALAASSWSILRSLRVAEASCAWSALIWAALSLASSRASAASARAISASCRRDAAPRSSSASWSSVASFCVSATLLARRSGPFSVCAMPLLLPPSPLSKAACSSSTRPRSTSCCCSRMPRSRVWAARAAAASAFRS